MQYNITDDVVVVVSSAGRPQLGQWLLEQVQSGQYGGLYMLDRDTFRIPWKHNSRKDCGDEDNRIFRVSQIWILNPMTGEVFPVAGRASVSVVAEKELRMHHHSPHMSH